MNLRNEGTQRSTILFNSVYLMFYSSGKIFCFQNFEYL